MKRTLPQGFLRGVFFSLFFLSAIVGHAQVRNIAGIIQDEKSGGALPGVSELIKGTTNGTITDSGGRYELQTDLPNPTLVFSFVGFVTREIPANTSNTLDVSMSEDSKTLSEVVVTALGITREQESLGYA